MDVSTLHSLTEDLAAFLSEVTQSELRQPVPRTAGDVGDLYLRIIDQNVSVAAAITGQAVPRGGWHDPLDRASLDASVNSHGDCGLETGYRQTARLMENAFDSVTDRDLLCRPRGFPEAIRLTTLYDIQISNTVIRTWDIARAIALPYQSTPDITRQVLRTLVLWPSQGMPPIGSAGSTAVDPADAFECVLRLSGRSVGPPITVR